MVFPFSSPAPPPTAAPDNGIPYCTLFLCFSLLVWALELYIDLRQRRRLCEKQLPAELSQDFTDAEFSSACDYSIDRISFKMLSDAMMTMSQVLFLLMGGFAWMWSVSAALVRSCGASGQNEIVHSMAFCLVFLAKSVVESAPFDLYETFVLEERHGFNKQTLRLWVADQIKTNMLILVLGFPAIAFGIRIIQWAGPQMWLYVWGFCLVLLVVFMFVFPNVISPLFNTFAPLQEGELKTAIEALAAENKFPLKELFVIDGSQRSSHSNAYFYGFGSNKRIVLYDTLNPSLLKMPQATTMEGNSDGDPVLVEKTDPVDPKKICTVDEIVAILAHELGHWALSHLPKQLLLAEMHLLVFFFLFGHAMNSAEMFRSFGFTDERPIIIGLILVS